MTSFHLVLEQHPKIINNQLPINYYPFQLDQQFYQTLYLKYLVID